MNLNYIECDNRHVFFFSSHMAIFFVWVEGEGFKGRLYIFYLNMYVLGRTVWMSLPT
jgi:hypothetical protein